MSPTDLAAAATARQARDHARQPSRHLWRADPAGEFCRKAFRAGGDSGWLCRAKPDRRACARPRHVAVDVGEPALCARRRPGPQCRAARSNDGVDRGQPCGDPGAAVAVMEQCDCRRPSGRPERPRHGVVGAAGRSVARPATCSAAPSKSPRPRSSCCSQHGSHGRRNKSLADPARAGRRTARRHSWPGCAGRCQRCRGLRCAQGEIAARVRVRSAARRAGPGKPRSPWGSIRSTSRPFANRILATWTGRRHDDLVAELGDAYQAFWKSPAGNRPPGGESFVDQIDRARDGLTRLPAGEAVLVVHSGTVRAVLAIALDLTPDSALRFVIDPLSLTRIDRLDGGWRVGAVNQRWWTS